MKKFIIFFRNLKVNVKLSLVYTLISLFPVLLLGIFSYRQANENILIQANNSLDISANQVAESINEHCIRYQTIIASITENTQFLQIFDSQYDVNNYPSFYREFIIPFFENITKNNSGIRHIAVYTQKDSLSRESYIKPMSSAISYPWFSRALTASRTKYYNNKGTINATKLFLENPSITIPNTPSMLVLDIDPACLFKSIDELKLDSFGIKIYDDTHLLIYSKSSHISFHPSYENLQMVTKGNNRAVFAQNGKQYTLICLSIPSTNWKMYYYTDISQHFMGNRSILWITLLLTCTCIVVLILFIGLFSNTFVKGIRQLNHKMELVESGNLKIEVSSADRDEIGELTNHFGLMLKQVNQLIDQVYQSKITQKETELMVLQSQINPHFLYNVLSIVNWKALEIGASDISKVINMIAKYYRTVLNKGKNTISVRDELSNAKAYMNLQKITHNNSFDFYCNSDDRLLDCTIVNFILQPILENALSHGIDMLKNGKRGKIELKVIPDGKDIVFTVSDNGPGISEEICSKIFVTDHIGYGIRNVNDRMQIRYGKSYGIRIEKLPTGGTLVTIRIPQQSLNIRPPIVP